MAATCASSSTRRPQNLRALLALGKELRGTGWKQRPPQPTKTQPRLMSSSVKKAKPLLPSPPRQQPVLLAEKKRVAVMHVRSLLRALPALSARGVAG